MSKDGHSVKIKNPVDFLVNAGKGVFMGVADVVPGVSGGTIALVMGIYDQLITTITRFDARLPTTIRRGQFTQALSLIHI